MRRINIYTYSDLDLNDPQDVRWCAKTGQAFAMIVYLVSAPIDEIEANPEDDWGTGSEWGMTGGGYDMTDVYLSVTDLETVV